MALIKDEVSTKVLYIVDNNSNKPISLSIQLSGPLNIEKKTSACCPVMRGVGLKWRVRQGGAKSCQKNILMGQSKDFVQQRLDYSLC